MKIRKREWVAVLLLDYDTRDDYREFPMRARFLARWLGFPLSAFRVHRRRTARGWHIVVYGSVEAALSWPEITPMTTVAAQAILGSDWKREGFNLVRAMHIDEAPVSWRDMGKWNTLYSRKMGAYNNGIGETAPPLVHGPLTNTHEV